MEPGQSGHSGQSGQPEQPRSEQLTDNPDESRFEIRVGGELAGIIQYHRRGDQLINLIHTEVSDKFQGAGLAGKLARFALDTARREHLDVLPTCPYVLSWITRHPDYADLVPAGRRAEFGISGQARQ